MRFKEWLAENAGQVKLSDLANQVNDPDWHQLYDVFARQFQRQPTDPQVQQLGQTLHRTATSGDMSSIKPFAQKFLRGQETPVVDLKTKVGLAAQKVNDKTWQTLRQSYDYAVSAHPGDPDAAEMGKVLLAAAQTNNMSLLAPLAKKYLRN